MILFRSLCFTAVMIISGFLCSCGGLLIWLLAPSILVEVPKFWAKTCIIALRLICGIKLQIDGLKNLPRGACIIAAQHQSALDIFIWLSILPRPALVFKQELAKIPLFGNLLVPSGMISIDRAGGGTALRKMLTDCGKAAADGRQIVIFPEGTRAAPGVRLKLQPGIVAVAQTSRAPVLPATTNSGGHWASRALIKTPGIVNVTLFPALTPGLRRQEMLAQLEACFYEG